MTTLPLLADLPENPVPRGTVSGEIITDDKVRIRYARWAATSRRRRGTILLLHGRSEFVEKYFETSTGAARADRSAS
jgi:lysophospholipase